MWKVEIDTLELHTFGRNLRQFSQFVRPATAALINKICFQIRTESLKVISENMTIRNMRFVAGRLRYQKAVPQLPVGRQFGLVGAWADKPRFGGWRRQVGKAEPPRQGGKRTILLSARGGDESAQVKPRFRVKPASHFISAKDMHGGKTPLVKQHILIRRVFKEKFTAPFVLGKPKLPGLYRRKGNRLEVLQLFRRDRKKTRRVDWMNMAIKRGLKRVNLEKDWFAACRNAMNKIKSR